MTPEDIEAEYWAYEYLESGTKESFDDDDFDDMDDDVGSFEDWENLIDES